MDEWRTRIRCYPKQIADWYAGLSVREKADADEFLKNMRKTRDWSPPHYRWLRGDGQGLGELRWRSEKKEHRLLGFFMGGCWYALVGCTHKQQVYNPPGALGTAKRRKGQIERGEVSTVEYDL